MFASKIHIGCRAVAAAGVALALNAAALAAPLPQDSFEPNDDCTAPPVIPVGMTTGLTLGPDSDYFTLSIPTNAEVIVRATDSGGNDLDVELLESGCAASLAAAVAGPMTYFDCAGVPRDLVIFVDGTNASGLDYSLDVSAVEIVDDSYENNDSCSNGSTVRIESFSMPNLVVTGCDEDYYNGRLQVAGTAVQIDVVFSHDQGDVDLELYDVGCGTLLDSSTSTTDNESVSFTNTSNPSVPQGIFVRVFMKNGIGHADYNLTACFGDAVLPPLGNQVCTGVPNSTGVPSTLCGRGSTVAADNELYLYVVDLPNGSWGYFITSPIFKLELNPGGSMGNICLDVPGRYNYNALFTGNTSAVFYRPFLPITPVGGGTFTSLMAGTTQLWQYWHRDAVNGMLTSNFSSALEVVFQ